MTYAKLTAKIPAATVEAYKAGTLHTYAGKNYSGDKETVSSCNVVAVVAVVKGRPVDVITCRIYMGLSRNSSTVYATVWLHGKEYHASGSGQAGGYGYNKESAAVDTALSMAGVKLSRSIHGTGETREALEATARALGYRGQLLTITN